jgi:hypothetical protein
MRALTVERTKKQKHELEMRTPVRRLSIVRKAGYLGGILLALALAAAALASLIPAGQDIRRIDAADLVELTQGVNPPIILDTRASAQYAADHIMIAISLSAAELDEHAPALPRNRLIVAYCG